MAVRIRLRFASTPLHYAKKCCFLFDRDSCRTVGDLAYLITARFGVEARGIQLFLDDFLLPPNESASIVRDNDIIEVKTVEDNNNERSNDDSDGSPTNTPPVPKKAKKRQNVPTQTKPSPPVKTHATSTKTLEKAINSAPKQAPKAAVAKTKPGPRPAVQKKAEKKRSALKTVQKKSVTGGTHLTFHSSSSSSSSSPSSSSSSDSSEEETEVAKNKAPAPKQTTQNLTYSANSIETTPVSSRLRGGHTSAERGLGKGRGLRSPQLATENGSSVGGSPNVGGASGRRGKRRGRGRGRGWIVGGEGDVLTVKSVVCTNSEEKKPRGGERGGESNKGGEKKDREKEHEDANTTSTSGTPPTQGGSSIWETSRAGCTRENSQDNSLTQDPEAGDGERVTVSDKVIVARDYSTLPALLGAPRVGDTIAFKVLELSSDCTPEISDYKEAEVVGYDAATSNVTVKYSNTLCKEDNAPEGSQKSALLRGVVQDEEEEELVDESHDDHVTLNLGSLLQPKLINQQ